MLNGLNADLNALNFPFNRTMTDCSLVTWQMLCFQYSSNSYYGYQAFQDDDVFIERSFEALRRSFGLPI